jgi:hypothetical protein
MNCDVNYRDTGKGAQKGMKKRESYAGLDAVSVVCGVVGRVMLQALKRRLRLIR